MKLKTQSTQAVTQWLKEKTEPQSVLQNKKRNFVFQGGGVKGIAFLGALSVISEQKILDDVDRVGGSSAGAIVALLLGLGFSFEELKEQLNIVDFASWKDLDQG